MIKIVEGVEGDEEKEREEKKEGILQRYILIRMAKTKSVEKMNEKKENSSIDTHTHIFISSLSNSSSSSSILIQRKINSIRNILLLLL